MTSTHTLEGGFINAPVQSAQSFRKIMNVMAKPGTIENLAVATPPAPLSAAAGSLLLTLCDAQTPIYLSEKFDNADVKAWITFHCNSPFSDAKDCMFALGAWDQLQPLHNFPIGTPEYPDRSTTMIVEMDELSQTGAVLSGPGIKEVGSLSLPETLAFEKNALLFPLGHDFYFTCGEQIAALPRTTKVQSAWEKV
ncbi:MAG: phosphonate C-P lyase system protein PhnH [Lentilitoribacter sp.]